MTMSTEQCFQLYQFLIWLILKYVTYWKRTDFFVNIPFYKITVIRSLSWFKITVTWVMWHDPSLLTSNDLNKRVSNKVIAILGTIFVSTLTLYNVCIQLSYNASFSSISKDLFLETGNISPNKLFVSICHL